MKNTHSGFLYVLILAFSVIYANEANSQPVQRLMRTVCLPDDQMRGILTGRYGESIMLRGTANEGDVVEVWVGKDKTFTIVASPVPGILCIIADGEDLKFVKEPGRES